MFCDDLLWILLAVNWWILFWLDSDRKSALVSVIDERRTLKF